MFYLSRQERSVILFLLSVALLGSGINFVRKMSPPLEAFLAEDPRLGKVDINKASLEDFTLNRCLPANIAKEIIRYRASYGPFSSLEEVKKIKGIGAVRYKKIEELFFVQ